MFKRKGKKTFSWFFEKKKKYEREKAFTLKEKKKKKEKKETNHPLSVSIVTAEDADGALYNDPRLGRLKDTAHKTPRG